MIDVAKLIKSPVKDEQWIAKVVIGGVVSLIPVLGFCGLGYIASLIRKVIRGDDDKLPEWTNWGRMFTDGILYGVAAFLYMLIPFLIFSGGVFLPGLGISGFLIRTFSIFIAVVAALGASFLLPMAICNFVAGGNFKFAFDFKSMQDKIKLISKDYGTAYLIALGLTVGVYFVSLFLGLIIIGWILAPFLGFYLNLVVARMFAEIYPKGEEDIITAEEEESEERAEE